jgi:hypothetical protein
MDNVELVQELKSWYETNKNHRYQNTDVKQQYYDKILDRYQNNKRTNVKSITSVDKIVQYYIASLMIKDFKLSRDIEKYVWDIADIRIEGSMSNMFVDITYETPEVKSINNPKLIIEQNKIYMINDNNKIELICEEGIAEYYLLPNLKLNCNCWRDFENMRKAPIGSPGVSISVPWKIRGDVVLDKTNNKYKISKITCIADYSLSYSNYNLVARYTGLHNSAWVYKAPIESDYCLKQGTLYTNKEWEERHTPVTRGNVYIFRGNQEVAHVRGEWDGNYNNMSFEKLADLLEKIV